MGAKIYDGQKWVDVYDTITDNYSLLLVSTTDESFIGKTVTVTATGEGAKREEYTKRFTALNAQPFFRLNQITTYTVTCGDEVRTVTVNEYGNYTVSIETVTGLVLYDSGIKAEGLEINSNGNYGLADESEYINIERGTRSENSYFNIVKQFELTGTFTKLVVKGTITRRRTAAGGSVPDNISEFAAATVNKATSYNSTITHKSSIPNIVGDFTSELSLAGITGTMWCGFIGQNYGSSQQGNILNVTKIYLE